MVTNQKIQTIFYQYFPASSYLLSLSHEQLYRMQCLVHGYSVNHQNLPFFSIFHISIYFTGLVISLGFARVHKQDTVSLFMLEKSCLSCSYINKFIQVLQVSLGGFWEYSSELSSKFLAGSRKHLLCFMSVRCTKQRLRSGSRVLAWMFGVEGWAMVNCYYWL